MKVLSQPDVAELIARLGGAGPRDEDHLNFAYGEVLAIVQSLAQMGQLAAADDVGQAVEHLVHAPGPAAPARRRARGADHRRRRHGRRRQPGRPDLAPLSPTARRARAGSPGDAAGQAAGRPPRTCRAVVLGAVDRGEVDRVGRAAGVSESVLAQTIGFPAECPDGVSR